MKCKFGFKSYTSSDSFSIRSSGNTPEMMKAKIEAEQAQAAKSAEVK